MLTIIFFHADNFCKQIEKQLAVKLLISSDAVRKKAFKMTSAEVMTISIYYHCSGYKTFKEYYEKHVLIYMTKEFPNLVSYTQFLELRSRMVFFIFIFTQIFQKPCTGVSFIDSFPLKVCHVRRTSSHKTFKGIARKGKTSMGWFFGFKLHTVINHLGEIVAFALTPGNIADNNSTLLTKITKKLWGKLFGDRGYLINSELFKKLYLDGLQVITRVRSNMENKLMLLADKIILNQRGVVESAGNLLKNTFSLEHTRHRSVLGFFTHVFSAIAAYNFHPNKPSVRLFDASHLFTT